MHRPNIPLIYVLSVPYVAAFVPVKGIEISGLRYTGFIWMAYLIVGLFIIFSGRRKIWFPMRIWTPWFLIVGISFLWSSRTLFSNLQAFLQMTTPLIVGVVSSFAITTPAEWRKLTRGYQNCLIVMTAGFLFYSYGPVAGRLVDHVTIRPAAMTLSIIAAVAIAHISVEARPNIIRWLICLGITALSGSRTATVVVLSLWPVSPALRNSWKRFILLFLVCSLALALFFTPIFQQRFFREGQGSLKQVADGDYNDAGRGEVWSLVRKESKRHIVLGGGVGESDIFVSSNFTSIAKVHNDYLRIIFEFGLVGLIVFLSVVSIQIFDLYKMLEFDETCQRTASAASILAIYAWLILSFTDNGLLYGVYFTHLIFVLIGAAYGLRGTSAKRSSG